ncbi:MAG: dephospho-CoA kinase [Clostridia bacterium]|nr:dephospho-CoA kinase [Clostridia bacterium]
MKKIIGLTGGTGTGKSSVSALFKKRGAHVIDADLTARKIVEPGRPALNEIKNHFGDKVINDDGTLNRKALAAIVFSDSSELDILDKITHKYVKEDILNEIKNTDNSLFVIDAPLLHKGGLAEICDVTLAVVADDFLRKKRIIARDNLTQAEAENRIKSQKSNDYYSALCDFTIENNENIDNLKESITKIIENLENN